MPPATEGASAGTTESGQAQDEAAGRGPGAAREPHLLDVGFLERGAPQRPLNHRLAHLQDALPEELQEPRQPPGTRLTPAPSLEIPGEPNAGQRPGTRRVYGVEAGLVGHVTAPDKNKNMSQEVRGEGKQPASPGRTLNR